ncbi:hypothetical protein LPJ78_004268 [Coemansia sp. RSA 989]|nr:hypothetical protein LPJ78_004268 [Coemansia sp. RSA 989]
MIVKFWRLLVTFSGPLLATSAHALVPRVTEEQLKLVKGGMLVKDGLQTSCNLAVIDSKASVVAAACLNFMSDGSLNTTTKYTVYLDDGADGKAAKYTVDSVTVHPEYNATYQLNNLATLQYNADGETTFQNMITPIKGFEKWDELVYTRYTLKDMETMEWEPRSYNIGWLDAEYKCDGLSMVHTVNVDDMMCTDKLSRDVPNYLNPCPMPYGTALGIYQNNVSISSLYMNSAIKDGDSLCSYTEQYTYFTVLARYIGYFEKVIGRSIDVGADLFLVNVTAISLSDSFSMYESNFTMEDKNITMLDGDFYKDQTEDTELLSSLSESELASSFTGSSDDPAVNGIDTMEDSNDSSNRNSIIIGVCVSVGGLLVICALIYYVYWQRRHGRNFFGRLRRTADQATLEAEFGGLSVGPLHSNADSELPPVYDDPIEQNTNVSLADSNTKTDEKTEKKKG